MRGLRSDAARNHIRIVTAAAQAFEEDGAAVSLQEIARRSGVGVATLYRRFGTREELIKEVFDHVFAADIASAIVDDGPDPWADLVATLTATVEAVAAHDVLVALARESALIGMETITEYTAARERVLLRARNAGLVRADLTPRDVTAVVTMTLAIVRDERYGPGDARRYLTLLIDGMRPSGQPLPDSSRCGPHGPDVR